MLGIFSIDSSSHYGIINYITVNVICLYYKMVDRMKMKAMLAVVSTALLLSMPMTVFAAASPTVPPTPPTPSTPTTPTTPTPEPETPVIVPEASSVSPKTYDFGYTSMTLMMGAGSITAVLAARKARKE